MIIKLAAARRGEHLGILMVLWINLSAGLQPADAAGGW
jgi:hypothetical protein